MSKIEHYIKDIDRYLNNEMGQEEKNEFERLLLSDEIAYDNMTRKEIYDMHKDLIIAVQAEGIKKSLQCVQKRDNAAITNKNSRIINIWRTVGATIISMAAMVTIILTTTIYPIAENNIKYHGEEKFSKYTSQYKLRDVKLSNAISLIEQGNYTEAKVELSSLKKELSLVKDKSSLNYSKEDWESYYKIEWLTAICNMQQGNVFKSRYQLKKISKSESPFSDDAKEILRLLD